MPPGPVDAENLPWIELLPDLAVVVDYATKQIHDINSVGARALGYERTELIGRSFRPFVGAVTDDGLAQVRDRALRGEIVHFDREVFDLAGGGRIFNLAARYAPELGPQMCVVTGREFGAMAKSDSQLAALMKLADLTHDSLVVVDRRGRIRYHSAAATTLHGPSFGVGERVMDFLHPDDTGFAELITAATAGDHRAEARLTMLGPDGEARVYDVRVVYDPESGRWFAIERDISAAVDNERELERQALTDALTGLPNRVALERHLVDTIDRGGGYSVLWLDMDDFKSVNDTFGHAIGDLFLQGIAGRIRGAVKDSDMVARLGGDEFIVVLQGIAAGEAEAIAERIIGAVGLPFALDGLAVERSCSIGIAFPSAGDTFASILSKADRASYRAKEDGRGRWAIHSTDLDLRAPNRVSELPDHPG